MNAQYRALHEGLNRINNTLQHPSGILPTTYTQGDADKLYDLMVGQVPVGTRVRVTYLPSPSNPANIVTEAGVVESYTAISIDEPSFHVKLDKGNRGILVPGSVLEAI